MQISPSVIDEILGKTSIVDVVSEYVELEKKGKNHVGLCPFHGDTNPSMSVSEDKKIFKCFSCGAGGNVIKFVQDFERISFVQATKKVADKVGIQIDVKENRFHKYHLINKEASDFYGFYINNTSEGVSIKSYLTSRGITDDIIKQFEIGYAPDGNLLYKSLRNKQIEPLDIITVGLANKVETSYYDNFRSRIMFPIWDSFGNTVGFSGRTVGDSDQAKYVNSSESSLFKKGEILYNYHKAANSIKTKKRVVLMEGFMDVISAYTAGLKEVVATMGTALTPKHIAKLKKITEKIIICFDGDNPGQEAAYKTLNQLKDFDVRVVMLPDGLDPDDYIKKFSAEAFMSEIENAKDVISFIFEHNLKKVDRNSVHELEQFKNAIFSLVEKTSNVQIELYLNRLAQELGVSYDSINNDFIIKRGNKVVKDEPRTMKKKYFVAEAILISIMLTEKKKALTIDRLLAENHVDDINYKLRLEVMRYYRNYSQFDSSIFIEQLSKPLSDHFINNRFNETSYISEKQVEDCVKVVKEYQVLRKKEYIESQLLNLAGAEAVSLKLELAQITKLLKRGGSNE